MTSVSRFLPLLTTALLTPWAPGQAWTLVWADEFDGPSIDTANWSHEVNAWGGGNSELQWYTDRPENSFISGGALVIRAIEESHTAFDPTSGSMETRDYTSARLRTVDKFDFTYGRIEVRARVPGDQGLWPAAWMLPTDWIYGGWASSGEIDIMEHRGDQPTTLHGTIHHGGEFPANVHTGTTLNTGVILSDEFHVYAIEWEEGVFRWYFDGALYQSLTEWFSEGGDYPAPFDQDFHILLNCAVGGNFLPDPVPGAPYFPKDYEIDYVRVYQRDGAVAQSAFGGSAIPVPGRVEAESFDVGGQSVTYLDTDEANNGGAHRPGEGVDIEATTDAGGGFNVGWVNNNEWLEYTIDVQQQGIYELEARVASETNGGTMRAIIDPDGAAQEVGPAAFGATGGWQTWTTVSLGQIELLPGEQIVRLRMEASDFNLNWVDFTLITPTPAVLTAFWGNG